MIYALAPDKVYDQEEGLLARCGAYSFLVHTPRLDAEKILLSKEPVIWTILEIDGDRISSPVLVGTHNKERRDLYQQLKSLQGVGRKSALLVLDCGHTIDIMRAVAGDDGEFFGQVPGLGKKRIDNLIATLKKKYSGDLPQKLPAPTLAWVEARDALVSSGKDPREAEKILFSREGSTAEELLREDS